MRALSLKGFFGAMTGDEGRGVAAVWHDEEGLTRPCVVNTLDHTACRNELGCVAHGKDVSQLVVTVKHDDGDDDATAGMIHLDHHKILPAWDSIPPDDDSANFDPDAFLSDSPKPASTFSADNQNPPSTIAVTKQDAEDPAVVSLSPPTQPPPPQSQPKSDPNQSSPSAQDSSPLSQIPDPASPQTHTGDTSPPTPPASADQSTDADGAQRPRANSIALKTGLEPSSSRQSTPLSEPPDQEDDADPSTGNLKEGMTEESAGAEANDSNDANTSKQPALNGNGGGDPANESRQDSNASSWNNGSTFKTPAGPQNDLNTVIPSPVPPSPASSTSQPNDSKVVTVLELNAELLKVFMEFQTRGVQMNSDPVASQYYARLQSNLAWLAGAADQSRQGNASAISLPMMDPPASVDFTSTDRIRQLYSTLPSIFAKEMARRQQAVLSSVNAATAPVPRTPTPSVPGTPSINHLKRERPHDSPIPNEYPNIKRRDTGDSKPPLDNIIPQSPASNLILNTPNLANGATPQILTTNSLNAANGNAGMMPQGAGMPASTTPSFTGPMGTNVVNTAEAQLAASNRERLRQAQIRQAQQLQMQQQRQMSPSSASNMSGNHQLTGQQMPNPGMNAGAANPASSSTMGNVNPSAMGVTSNFTVLPAQTINTLNSGYQQLYQILHTPNHPFVNFMLRTVPGFVGLPIQAQLQKMMVTQTTMQQQRMSNMGGNGSMSPTASVGGGGQQFPMANQNMSPVSPVSQSPSIPSGGQGFSMGNNMSPTGMDSRMQMSSQGMTQQQRQQLYLLQQQGRANGNAAGNNPQAMMYFQQQQQQERMRQMNQQPQANSPTIASPSNMPDLSALQSNAGIPGIARSARSPSDNAPSPMTPRVATRGPSMGQEDYQRMLMAQHAQANRAMSTQSPASFNQGSMQNWSQNPMQLQQGLGNGGFGGPQQQQQNWQQQQQHQGGNAGYPFASTPSGDLPQTPRHMSSTPAPQNSVDQSAGGMVGSSEFDLLNWPQ